MKNVIIISLIILYMIASICYGQSSSSGKQSAEPIKKYLNPDGTINTKLGFNGSLDPKGYRMTTGKNGAPRFIKPKEIASTNIDFEDSEWDPRFAPPGTNGEVHAIYVDSYYGNVYVGGLFTQVGGKYNVNNVAVWRGTQWDSLGSGIIGQVNAISLFENYPYRYIVVGGSITKAGGISVNNIAKWDLNTKSWSAMGTGVSGSVYALAYNYVGGNNLYVGGSFTNAGGITVNNVVRYNGSSSSWLQMKNGANIGTDGPVYALHVVLGAVYAGGSFTTAGGVTSNGIAKWSSGSWNALGTGLSGGYFATTARAITNIGSSIYVGGDFYSAGSVAAYRVARWNGTSWSSLGSSFTEDYDVVNALATDGTNLFAGGSLKTPWDQNNVYRWNGTTWQSLGGPSYWDNVYALAMYRQDYDPPPDQFLPTNTLCVGGIFTAIAGLQSRGFATWYDGEWSASGNGVEDKINAFASDGNDLYAGGELVYAGGLEVSSVAKWNGTKWDSLDGTLNGEVLAIAIIGTDVYVGGGFTFAGGVSANGIAKWDGTEWSALGPGVNGGVFALGVMGTDLYVGGSFTMAGGSGANRIAKWDGSDWSALGLGTNGGVYAITVMGSDVYVGGDFTTAGPGTANRIARWNGTHWFALGTGMNTTVLALASDGTYLYAGGYFTTAGGVSASKIAKWDGAVWSALGTGVFGYVLTLAVSGMDLYAGGYDLDVGVTEQQIARWDGTNWDSLGSGIDGDVLALAVNRGAIFAGGQFNKAGNMKSSSIARWGLPHKSGGMIAGRVFLDENNNGLNDIGEEGVAGTVNISLADDPFEYVSIVADDNGYYHLDEVEDGEYLVTYTLAIPEEKITYPSTADHSHYVEITDGNAVVNNDFGIYFAGIALYNLWGDAHDALGKQSDMILTNTPFLVPNGISSDGAYGTTNARTPQLVGFDYSNFSILANFSISEYPPAGGMPVFIGGMLSRWIGFYIQSDGTISMKYNNSSYEGSAVLCTLNEPHTALVTYDSTTGIGRFYLDDVLAGSVSFSLTHSPGDNLVLISDYSNGKTFKGNLYGLYIANADISPMLLDASIINGIVYNDLDGDGEHDSGEPGLSGWDIYLETGDPDFDMDTTTDINGFYQFTTDRTMVVRITESAPDDWIRTFPPPPGEHIISVGGPAVFSGINFGNKGGYRYIGSPGGNWSNSSNWSGGHVPQPDEIVIIPVNVTVDALPNDSILGLRVLSGATLTFSASAPRLKVVGDVIIGNSGAIVYPSTLITEKSLNSSSSIYGMICYANWINKGSFTAGHSMITFAGDLKKKISTTNFYDLEISGLNSSTNGNLGINNTLLLHKLFEISDRDTVIVTNTATTAIQDTGRIIRGTLKRYIAQSETGIYRFESPLSFVKFDGTGSYPTSMAMTIMPDTVLPSFKLKWQLVGGIVDPSQNSVTFDTVKNFSRWVFGIPRLTSVNYLLNKTVGTSTIAANGQTFVEGLPIVRRSYNIDAEGGSNYRLQLCLRYEQSEVPAGTIETNLRLLRGPFFVDSVDAGWNMVSLPLIPDYTNKDRVFPASVSNAFSYDGHYLECTNLNFGSGYWLKFLDAQQAAILGDDRSSTTIPVKAGWNLIGTISYPIATTSVISNPTDIITSEYFGYNDNYFITDSLLPMHSYWVKTSLSGDLTLATSGVFVTEKREALSTILNRLNILTINDAMNFKQNLYFGSDDKLDSKQFDLPPQPPAGIFDVRYSSGKFVEVGNAKSDRVIPFMISSAKYPLTLRWQIVDSETQAWLGVGIKENQLKSNGQITITNPNESIWLRLGSQGGQLPSKFALHQNYPNPFNPVTSIKYDLPVGCKVTVSIFNILGQEVARLIDEEQSPGYKLVEWNANNFASGVYFIKISAQNEVRSMVDVKKMLLIK